jgi:uncharacterized protein (DUF2062 family)
MNAVPQSFWRRRFLTPLIQQMRQGISVEKLALSIALGFVLGIFPIMGATTLLCLVAGFLLRLNQPAIQLVNYLVYPLQIPLILFFVRLGERMFAAEPLAFSISELLARFRHDPWGFFRQFGVAGFHGIMGWIVVAPLIAWPVYKMMITFLSTLSRKQTISTT